MPYHQHKHSTVFVVWECPEN